MKRRQTLLAVVVLGALLSVTARAQDLARGEQLFALCAQCHGDQGQGSPLALAPSIGGLEPWYVVKQLQNFKDGVRAMHFDDLAGMRMRPMARWLKTADDVNAVAAYVGSLPPAPIEVTLVGGDAARGAALYATCSGCHGVKGEGVEAVGAPSLRHTSDWYQRTQIKNYQQGIRGSDPRDVGGAAMRGMSMLLADDQAIKDVLAHIATLSQAPGGGAE
jgi:cytochrome c oxidase subunit 2